MTKKLHEYKKMSRLRKLTIKSIQWNAITKIIISFYTQQFSGGIKWLCESDQRLYTQTVTAPKGLTDITEKLMSKKPFKRFQFDSFVTLRIFGQKNASTIYGAYRIRKKALEFFDMPIQQCRSVAVNVGDPSLKEIVTKLGRNLTGLQKTIGIGGGTLLGGIGLYALHKKRERIKELFSKGVFDLRDIFSPQELLKKFRSLSVFTARDPGSELVSTNEQMSRVYKLMQYPTPIGDKSTRYGSNPQLISQVQLELENIIQNLELNDASKAPFVYLKSHILKHLGEMTNNNVYNFRLLYLENKSNEKDIRVITWIPADNQYYQNDIPLDNYIIAFKELLNKDMYILGEDYIYIPTTDGIELSRVPVVKGIGNNAVFHLNNYRRLEKWFNEDGTLNKNRLTELKSELRQIVSPTIFPTS